MKTSRFACLSVLLSLAAGAATVSDVSFRQDRGTRVVTVNYTLSNEGNPAYVTMEVLDGDGVAIAAANLNIKTATGDISQIDGHAVPDDGQTKTITWPIMSDCPGLLLANASIRITAHPVDNPPPKYIYIDLSGGPDAASYQVARLEQAVAASHRGRHVHAGQPHDRGGTASKSGKAASGDAH